MTNLRALVVMGVLLASFVAQGQEACGDTDIKRAKKSYDAGMKELRNRNSGAAQIHFQKALEQDNDYAHAHWRLGRIYVQQLRTRDAEFHLKKVISLCPDYNAEVYLMLARIAYGKEDYTGAIPYLEEFLKDLDRIKRDSDYDLAVSLLDQAKFLSGIMQQKVPFAPYKVMDISTGEDEFLAIISPDGELILFTRRIKTQPGKGAVSWSERYQELLLSANRVNGKFEQGEVMPAPFNTSGNQGGVTITALNDEVFITICNTIRLENKMAYNNCDIYYTRLIYDAWMPLEKVDGEEINMDHTWESQPTVSADGKTMYFVSDRPGGHGGSDIYVTYRHAEGKWGKPVNLGPAVNTPGNEKTPFIHTDSQTLYFSSADHVSETDSVFPGHPGLGGYDIFFTRYQEGRWIKPVNIGYPINTVADELGFFVSTDGTTGYFSSNKIEGSGGYDLYAFDLYPEARPQKVLFIKGEVKDEYDMPVPDTKIELKNVATDEIIDVHIDPISARYVAIALFESDFVLTVKKPDHMYQSRLIDRDSAMYDAPVEISFELQKVETGKTYQLHDIYYASNSAYINEKSKYILNEFVIFLQENPRIKVAVHGHTDNVGDDGMNLDLSKRRAQAVYDYLLNKGVPSSRLTWQGYGKLKPVADNSTEEGRAKNRRTEFVISGN
jgi:outer membrane protein OmpA-like peptidoglycan-associated protein/tetratricopeptide (TPR) repeat protein